MKKTFKKLFSGFCLVMAIVIGILLMPKLSERGKTVQAEKVSPTLTAEMYTKSDNLLNYDGTLSERTIRDFAKTVKEANVATDLSEIEKVIPWEWLRTENLSDVCQYNGEEYGFYVSKFGNRFDVLLINFVYEFEENVDNLLNNQYKIRIEPILQESFTRTKRVDLDKDIVQYTWSKYYSTNPVDTGYKYYVANPRFITYLQNENEYNYGDAEYDKEKDSGPVIYQTRLNYFYIKETTSVDLEPLKKVALETILSTKAEKVLGSAGAEIVEIGMDLLSAMEDCIVHKTETYKCDAEEGIFQEKTKSQQREEQRCYSRSMAVKPEPEIILAGESSHAECITLLNENNTKCRLKQICDFDIVKIEDTTSIVAYMAEKIEGTDYYKPYSFSKERILFSDKSITSLEADKPIQEKLAYFLEDGDQTFEITPTQTMEYQISAPSKLAVVEVYEGENSVAVTKVNDRLSEMKLEAGKTYKIILSQAEEGYYNITFQRKATPIESLGNCRLEALEKGGSQGFIYEALEDTTLTIGTDSSNYIVRVYRADDNSLVDLFGTQDEQEFDLKKGAKYYIEFTNSTSSELPSVTWTLNKVKELVFNQVSEYFSIIDRRTFVFNAPVDGKYEITDLAGNLEARTDVPLVDGGYYLTAGEHYIVIEGNVTSPTRTQCCVRFVAQEIVVNGEEVQIVGSLKSVFLQFIPKVTANYEITLPSGIGVKYLIYNEMVQNTSSTNFSLEKGITYYFGVTSSALNLPAGFNVIIAPVTVTDIKVDEDKGIGETKLSGLSSGEYFISVEILELNIYSVTGIEEYTVYDNILDEVMSSSTLSAGKYYLKAKLSSGKIYQIKVTREGLLMEVGDTIAFTASRTFKYNFEKNTEYEIRIGGSKSHAFKTSILLKDSEGNRQTIVQSNDYYTFTATDNIMFVNLVMGNENGQAGIFVLDKKGSSSEEHVQSVSIGELYAWNVSQGGKYFKIEKGTYKICCTKKIGENIGLYQASGTFLIEQENYNDSTDKRIYYLTVTDVKVFLITTDQIEVDFLILPGEENVKYIIEVEEGELDNDELIRGNDYSFGLYYTVEGKKGRINAVPSKDFDVYAIIKDEKGGSDIEQIFLENRYFNFYSYICEQILVEVDFWSINTKGTFRVINPLIEADYFIEEGKLVLGADAIYSDKAEFRLDQLTINVFKDAELLDSVLTKDYRTDSVIFEISEEDYWKEAFWIKVSCIYQDKQNRSFETETVSEYKNEILKINDSIDLQNREFAYIDAASISGSTFDLSEKIEIPTTVKMINFVGNPEKQIRNLNILVCSDRETSLLINMKDFKFTFYGGDYGLLEMDYVGLYLNILGDCSIMPEVTHTTFGNHAIGVTGEFLNIRGSGSLYVQGSDDNSTATEETNPKQIGSSGIGGSKLVVSVRELTAVGGKGMKGLDATGTKEGSLDGNDGEIGGKGGPALFVYDIQVLSACQRLTLQGGDGGDGGNGASGLNSNTQNVAGGRGGNGGPGGAGGTPFVNLPGIIIPPTEAIEIAPSTVQKKVNGNMGDGGHGGDGGNGGTSAKGGDGGTGGDGYCGGIGGDGGNGGKGLDDTSTSGGCTDGGNGGNGGKGGYSYETSSYARPGDGGNGGDGGSPGNFGDGKKGGDGGYGYNGGQGGDGSKSKIPFGKGGKAGRGGDAYGGNVGQPGEPGGGTRKGDSNTPGTQQNNENETYKNYPI